MSLFQLRRARLSFVRITPLFKYHKNIFIFVGTLICHISCSTLTPFLINAAYIELTEKLPDKCKDQTKTSLSSCKFTSYREATILCQSCRFLPAKLRRKEMFKGTAARTLATEACFLLSILNNEENLVLSGWLSSQVSIQKRVCEPSLTLNDPNPMKVSLTFIRPFQKWESVGFLEQLPMVLCFRYLFRKRYCHNPSSFINLKSHLLNKHLFCTSKFCMPRPSCILGWHKIFHLANLYFRLCYKLWFINKRA